MRKKELEITDAAEIIEIISKADVCRVALANNDMPYIVTMNFGYSGTSGQKLFFHCANEGKKLEMLRKNSYVCFTVDTDHQIFPGEKGCDWGMKYSSVVGYGNIRIITEKKEKTEGLDCIMEHYGGKKSYVYDDKTLERTTLLELEIIEMTGKKC